MSKRSNSTAKTTTQMDYKQATCHNHGTLKCYSVCHVNPDNETEQYENPKNTHLSLTSAAKLRKILPFLMNQSKDSNFIAEIEVRGGEEGVPASSLSTKLDFGSEQRPQNAVSSQAWCLRFYRELLERERERAP